MSRAFLQRFTPKKPLVIHMDINKTIVQVDMAGGRTMEDVLNSNAAANVYGYVDPKDAKWKPLYGPKDARPTDISKELGPIMTYDTYIDQLHAEPEGMQQLPKKERDEVWKKISGARRAESRKFTFKGEVGEAYASLVEEQRQCLTKAPGQYHDIIMSFFHFINTLSELEWPFTLIFRTFGSDLPFILKEWKEFVTGVHDCKPRGKILEQIKANYVEPLTGCIYRDKESLYLCLGVCVSAIAAKIEEGDTEEVILAKLRALPGCTEVRQISFHSLSRELLQYYQASNNVGGLVDYYPCWAQAAEGRCGGKVFPVQLTGADHYTVFYDDNIFIGDEKSIVDLRDAESSASLLGEEVELPFCVPVNAYEAIVNEDYFLDRLCERLTLQQKRS